MSKRYLGSFVSCAGGLYKALEHGDELGVNTIMLHPSPPQRWNTKPFEQDAIDAFNEKRKTSKVEKVFFHGIYLINLAHPEKAKLHLAKLSLVHYLDLAEKINADGVVFHVGSFKEVDVDEALAQVSEAIDWIFEKSSGKSKLMLEVAAGAGNVIGDKFSELKKIYNGVKDRSRLQFCLDTQHMFGSGYDIKDNLEGVVQELEKELGIDLIGAVHFNDSKVELASHKDRHENLGEGLIGEEGMKGFLNHPKLKHLPFIMETPNVKDVETAQEQVDILKKWAKD
jgi:deoxyribonuclease IV